MKPVKKKRKEKEEEEEEEIEEEYNFQVCHYCFKSAVSQQV